MKLPLFVKTGLAASAVVFSLALSGCDRDDARQVVERGARQAGDTMGGATGAVMRSTADRFASEQLKKAGVDVAGELVCDDTRGSAAHPPLVVTCTGRTVRAQRIVVTGRLEWHGAGYAGEFVGTVAGREVFRRGN